MERLEIVYDVPGRQMPALVVREKVERRRAIHLTLEHQTEGGFAESAGDQAGHVAAEIPR